MTLSGGLRFETQNQISDHADFAPRLGFAWGLGKGKTVKTVLRAGYGMFYDRFRTTMSSTGSLNGINQKQYFVAMPDFFPTSPRQ